MKVYHYWVETVYGDLVSENATVVTSLTANTLMSEECNEEENLEKNLWVLRPELNCLRQVEDIAISKVAILVDISKY